MRMLIATGGTGDYIHPTMVPADVAKERYRNVEVLFVGNDDRMEAGEVPSHGYAFQGLHVSGLTGSVFNRCRALLLMMNCYRKACRIIDEFKPDIVIGFGGYVSVPVILTAHHKHVATMIHEQNFIVGVSSRMIAKYMDAVVIYYEKRFEEFNREKVRLLGNPRATNVVHARFDRDYFLSFGLNLRKPLVLVVMGSSGLTSVNTIMKDTLSAVGEQYQVPFATEKNNYGKMRRQIHTPHVKVVDYVKQLDIMAHIDLIVCRTGATAAVGIITLGTPSILMPSPYVAHNHQFYNASVLADCKAAVILEEKGLNTEVLSSVINRIMSDDLPRVPIHNASLAPRKPNVNEDTLNWRDEMKR